MASLTACVRTNKTLSFAERNVLNSENVDPQNQTQKSVRSHLKENGNTETKSVLNSQENCQPFRERNTNVSQNAESGTTHEMNLYANSVSAEEHKKFTKTLREGLRHSLLNLREPPVKYIEKKAFQLDQATCESSKKLLLLDLDETLIHSVKENESAEVEFDHDGHRFRFNVRPHCETFLQEMSEHFDIYLFTAATEDYCKPIMAYLNRNGSHIKGAMTRQHCLETKTGLRIKDLRIIKGKSLKDTVIVDNLAHSFGFQIDNGVPIVDFISNKEDRCLIVLAELLKVASKSADIRQQLRNSLKLRKVAN